MGKTHIEYIAEKDVCNTCVFWGYDECYDDYYCSLLEEVFGIAGREEIDCPRLPQCKKAWPNGMKIVDKEA